MKSHWRRITRKPVLSLTLMLVIGTFCGLSSTQTELIRQVRNPKQPADIASLCYVRLNVTDARADHRVPLGIAEEIAAHARTIERSTIYRPASMLMVDGEWADSLGGVYADARVFDVFRVQPFIGSRPDIQSSDPAVGQVAYITHRLWRRLPNADTGIVGRPVSIAGETVLIRGVLPPGMEIPNGAEIIVISPDLSAGGPGPTRPMNLVVRPHSGVSPEQVRSELNAIISNSMAPVPNREAVSGVELVRLPEHLLGSQGKNLIRGLTAITACFALGLLCSMGVLVLLKEEENEYAQMTRIALGASPLRLARDGIAEASAWVVSSIPFGVLIAVVYSEVLEVAFSQMQKQAFWLRYEPDPTFFLIFTVVAFLTIGGAQLFSLVRIKLDRLRHHQRTVTRSGRSLAKAAFVTAQIFLSIVLVALAWLLTDVSAGKTLVGQQLARTQIATFRLALPTTLVPNLEEQQPLLDRLESALQSMPGVAGVAIARRGGYGPGGVEDFRFEPRGAAEPSSATMSFDVVNAGYFRSLDLRVVDGREFEASDTRERRNVALVNQSFVRRYSPGVNPIGGIIERRAGKYEIVGVVPDLNLGGVIGDTGPMEGIYLHLPQAWRMPYITLLVRFKGAPLANLEVVLRRIVAGVSPAIVPYFISTIAQEIDDSYGAIDTMLKTALFFSFFAAIITGVAIVAIILFGIRCAFPELALRIALGATASRALRPMCHWLIVSAAVGIMAGVAGIWGASRYFQVMGLGMAAPSAIYGAGAVAIGTVLTVLLVSIIPGLLRIRNAPLGRLLSG